MVKEGEEFCPMCRNHLSYYDTVRRIVRKEGRITRRAYIRRLRCDNCGRIHRELPSFILPYKQYEARIIRGVISGIITPETSGFEDYPCEATMKLWRAKIARSIMRKGSSMNLT